MEFISRLIKVQLRWLNQCKSKLAARFGKRYRRIIIISILTPERIHHVLDHADIKCRQNRKMITWIYTEYIFILCIIVIITLRFILGRIFNCYQRISREHKHVRIVSSISVSDRNSNPTLEYVCQMTRIQ